ncbi:AI-2E family transporter [Haloprofundus halophilus]|uniref:AI-2E family transporter n=1 Tax=Haloprofundus halophilus TaxID=2283527 RepID=UPI000E43CD72|nr:AI-2E family transporter [Haloprofundus halophilus]
MSTEKDVDAPRTLLGFDRSRLGWWFLAALLAVALCYVVYSFIGTVVFGLFIYYATRPIFRRLDERIHPPSLAAAVAMFALVLPALALVGYALLIVVRQLGSVTGNGISPERLGIDPTVLEQLTELTDVRALLSGDLLQYLTASNLQSALDSLGSAAGTLAFLGIGLIHLFVMSALAFYLLRDDRKLASWFEWRIAGENSVAVAYLRAVDNDLNSIFFGNILNAAVTGTIAVIAYSALNAFAPPGVAIPAAALVGLLAGVASLVPVVGMKLVYFPVAIYMALVALVPPSNPAGLWFVAAFAAVSFVVVDTIPDLVLRPYVSGRSLHVGAVMLAYTLGPLLFGWYGIFLMPVLLVLVVHFARIILPELVSGDPIRPYAVDPSWLPGDPVEDAATQPTNGGEAVSGPVERRQSQSQSRPRSTGADAADENGGVGTDGTDGNEGDAGDSAAGAAPNSESDDAASESDDTSEASDDEKQS